MKREAGNRQKAKKLEEEKQNLAWEKTKGRKEKGLQFTQRKKAGLHLQRRKKGLRAKYQKHL